MTRLALAGFGIWLAASVALRAGGQWIFTPGHTAGILLPLGVSAPAMFALPRGLFARFSIPPERYALGAIALVAPGMLLDTISATWFTTVFPNIRADAAGLFGGWLLFCNVLALVSAGTALRAPDRRRDGAHQPRSRLPRRSTWWTGASH
jgi:hypothetical protein